MTDAAGHRPAYDEIAASCSGRAEARKRLEELMIRDTVARAAVILRERGEYDPGEHDVLARCPPLSVAEHLERVALCEYLSREYRPGRELDAALQAGASVAEVAAAAGWGAAETRERIGDWAAGQRELHAGARGQTGLTDARHAAAAERLSRAGHAPPESPRPGSGTEHVTEGETGQ